MKKLLPKTANNPKGFTLVELLIVISIIAILSTIGYAVYSGLGAQPKARNSKVKADIDAIAKALEVAKGTSSNYPALANSLLSNGVVPTSSGTAPYCATITLAQVTADNPSATWTVCTGIAATGWAVAADGTPATAAQWKVCGWLEAETSPTVSAGAYCRRSTQ